LNGSQFDTSDFQNLILELLDLVADSRRLFSQRSDFFGVLGDIGIECFDSLFVIGVRLALRPVVLAET
jgi:hypothetical protein